MLGQHCSDVTVNVVYSAGAENGNYISPPVKNADYSRSEQNGSAEWHQDSNRQNPQPLDEPAEDAMGARREQRIQQLESRCTPQARDIAIPTPWPSVAAIWPAYV